jgi:hypothetical protein
LSEWISSLAFLSRGYGEEKRRIDINSEEEKALLENSQVTRSVFPRNRFLVHLSKLPLFFLFSPFSLSPSLFATYHNFVKREKRIKVMYHKII